MPSFENPIRKLLRTNADLQLLKSQTRKYIRADGTISISGGGTGGQHDHSAAADGGVLTGAKHDAADDFTAIATPSNPAASHLSLYAKVSGGLAKLFYKQSDGTEVGPLAAAGAAAAHDHTTADGSGVLTGDEHDNFSEYAEVAAPSTPAANKVRIYPKSDGLMYAKDDAGVEREMGTVAHAAAADPHTGYVLESLLDAKGDLIAASADNTPGRLAVGTDGTMLQAYSAGAVGLRYQVAANAAIIANVSLSAEAAGTDDTWARGDHVHLLTAYSRKQYVFVPDAAPATTITAGDAQGPILHSGPNNETADALEVDAETAPGASGLPITVQYGDTNDLDTVASWTTIATLTLSSEKSSRTTSMTNATVTAARLLRMNVGTIVGTPKDCTVTLHTKAPLVA